MLKKKRLLRQYGYVARSEVNLADDSGAAKLFAQRSRQLDVLRFPGVIDDDEDLARRWTARDTSVDLDTFRDVVEALREFVGLHEPFCESAHLRVSEPGAYIGDLALADVAGNDGGLVVEPAVALAVSSEDADVTG